MSSMSTSGRRASALGHHILPPTSRFRAVTSTDLTTSVSSRTPKATAKPISGERDHWQRGQNGKRSRQHQTSRRDHPSGGGETDERPAPSAELPRFLVYAGHQEDVVVDPERDQEHEHEQREGGVGSREPKEVLEDKGADTEGRGERQNHRGDQDQRRYQRPQQQDKDDEHGHEYQRHDDPAVALCCPLGIRG